jgi:hypothetical protein
MMAKSSKMSKIMSQLKNPQLPGSYAVPTDTGHVPPGTGGMASGFTPPQDSGKPPADPAVEGGKHAPKGN